MPQTPDRLTFKLIERLVIAQSELMHLSYRATSAWGNLAGGVLAATLPEDELTALTLRLYARHHSTQTVGSGLREWESEWYDRDLPPAPSRVLVCAAGGGREVRRLLQRGYVVDAFEPSDVAFRELRQLSGEDCRVSDRSYREWVAAVEAGDSPRYDAVIFGWGSLSHVMTAASRAALWRAADSVCDGPILASFYLHEPHRVGRAQRLGQRIGGLLARARGRPARDHHVNFVYAVGFSEPLTVEEVESCARSIDRRASWYLRRTWPHVTLVRRSAQ